MLSTLQSAGDAFIWFTSIVAGIGALLGVYAAAALYLTSSHDKALLGQWFCYGYFQTRSGPRLFKEIAHINRSLLMPWRFNLVSRPLSDASPTVYRGRIISAPPRLLIESREPIYGDRTFEIYRRVMTPESHDANMFVGIHLGNSYESDVLSACAVLLTRRELDTTATSTRPANPDVEQAKFVELVRPFFSVDGSSLQLLLS